MTGSTTPTILTKSGRIIFHIATNGTSFVTSELSRLRGILKQHATEQGKKTAKVSHNYYCIISLLYIITSFPTPPSVNSSSDGESDDEEEDNNSSSSEDSSIMVKSTAKTTAKTTTKKKVGYKTTGLSDDEDGPTKKKTKVEAKATLYSVNVVKPITQQEYAKGTDDIIDVVLVVDGVPNKKAEPEVTLESDGKRLKIEWKTHNIVLSVMQATAQGIKKDSTHYQAYDNTMQQMYNDGIRPSNG